MHETFDHTADLGLRIRAADLVALFEEAAECLFECLVEDMSTLQPLVSREIELDGQEMDYLLFDWLKALLYLFDTEHLLLVRFEIKILPPGLRAVVWGEPYDESKHELAHEVKAITYHQLKVEETESGWLAEIIVDI